MQPGADKIANTPGRPSQFIPPTPQNSSPFISSAPVVGMQASESSRLIPPVEMSRPVTGTGASNAPGVTMPNLSGTTFFSDSSRLPSPSWFNGPANAPPAYTKQDKSAYQPPQAPRLPSTAQTVPPLGILPQSGPPNTQMSSAAMRLTSASNPTLPSSNVPMRSFQPSLPASIPPPQLPPPAEYNFLPRGSVPQSPLSMRFAAPGSALQPQSQGFPAAHPFHAPPSSLSAPPPPPIGAPVGYTSREQMQYPSAAPPLGASLQGLVEDFQSITLGSTPGSLEPGLDPRSLPRPLDSILEPISILEKYPLNCHPRFLRLTTHAIPSSQSLLARWHLPLGIVVHPMAEVPEGEEVPVVNFGPIGIVRCRRCRTYINPYATFTDAGRKWRCNICALLNDV
ncbi:hypothetical protein HPP92_015337 [Vanilla planifolia]|uniref:Zinc finger Sec23/Sec24-type domain-containing protein n=1 Tax=Vanilla planifolia TaxID=51239 RepID=A0A835QHN7_VANPL|nr:hypothetical protein HPP92_015337 [Vanilla planifolia]